MTRVRALARADEGSVLIAVVGIMIVLTVLVIGAFAMASDNLFQSRRDRGRAQALSVAEAGMEEFIWRLNDVNTTPASPAHLTIDVPEMGPCSIDATLAGNRWLIRSSGVASTTPGITRSITAEVLSMSIWDMFLAKGVATPNCGKINGSGTFTGSAYMEGDWPPCNGNAAFEKGPYFVKGGDVPFDQTGFGNATMGQGPYGTVDLYCDGTVSPLGSDFPIDARVHPSVPDLPMPKPDEGLLERAYASASTESIDRRQGPPDASVGNNDETRESGITTGVPFPFAPPYTDTTYTVSGYERKYKVIDNDGLYKNASSYVTSGTGTAKSGIVDFYLGKDKNGNKLPSFGRPYDPAIGHSRDDFAWDAEADNGDGCGVLTIQGTVYIDAEFLHIKDVKFAGKGVIVTTGKVLVQGKWEPACYTIPDVTGVHTLNSDPAGYPQKHVVGVSSIGPIYEYSPRAYGLFYTADESVGWMMNLAGGGSGDEFEGEVVAPQITMSHNASVTCTPNMGQSVPKGMPQSGQILAVTGWHEGQNAADN